MSFTCRGSSAKFAFAGYHGQGQYRSGSAECRAKAFIPYASQDKRIFTLGSRAANIQTLILEPLVLIRNSSVSSSSRISFTNATSRKATLTFVRNFSHYATMILRRTTWRSKTGPDPHADGTQLGNKIQSGLLPSKIPTFLGISPAGSMDPAKEIGGDYFDFLPLGNPSLGIVVGDVSGKGVPRNGDDVPVCADPCGVPPLSEFLPDVGQVNASPRTSRTICLRPCFSSNGIGTQDSPLHELRP